MSEIKTVKAAVTYTLPTNAVEAVSGLLNHHAAKAIGDNAVAKANAAMGKYMDQFFPIFPLLLGNQGATYTAFAEKADDAAAPLRKGFTEQDWVKAWRFWTICEHSTPSTPIQNRLILKSF
jgi:hypothetical protein